MFVYGNTTSKISDMILWFNMWYNYYKLLPSFLAMIFIINKLLLYIHFLMCVVQIT